MIDVLGTNDVISFDGRALEVFELIEGRSRQRHHVSRVADLRLEPYDAQSLVIRCWLRDLHGQPLGLPNVWQVPAASRPSAEQLVALVREAATRYAGWWGTPPPGR